MTKKLQVANLETLFTGNDDGLVATMQRAQKATTDFDGTKSEAELLADASDALAQINDLREELADLDGTRTEAEIQADVANAVADAEEIAEQLKAINDYEARPEVDIDADSVDRGLTRAKDGLGEFKDEANSTAREAAASFSGDPIDALDALQETAANALAGFGPAGAAAGIAAAVGLGIAQAKLQEVADKANEAAGAAGEFALEYRDATDPERLQNLRTRWDELGTQIIDAKSWFEPWQDEAVTAIEQIASAAEVAGPAVDAFVDAFNNPDAIERQLGLADALDLVRRELEPLERVQAAYDTAIANGTAPLDSLTQAERDRMEALKDLEPIIQDELETAEKQNDITRALAESKGLTVEAYLAEEDALRRAAEAQDAFLQALEDSADPVATYEGILQRKIDKDRESAEARAQATEDEKDSWEDYVTSVSVSTQDLIDEWNRQATEAAKFEENLAIIAAAGGQALADELRAKGPEVAGSVAAVIATSSPAQQRKAIEAHAGATGADISSTMADGVTENRGLVRDAVTGLITYLGREIPPVVLSFDTSQLEHALRNAVSGSRGKISVDARAAGGPVEAGVPYLVGELGQELFVPDVAGHIVPADETERIVQQQSFPSGGNSYLTVNNYDRPVTGTDVRRWDQERQLLRAGV